MRESFLKLYSKEVLPFLNESVLYIIAQMVTFASSRILCRAFNDAGESGSPV